MKTTLRGRHFSVWPKHNYLNFFEGGRLCVRNLRVRAVNIHLILEVCKMYSIRPAGKVSLFRDCVLAVLLSVVCSLLTAMPAACAGDRYALEFDGVDDYVDVPTTEYIFEDEHVFTIELWARWFDDTRSLCSNRYHVQRSRFRTRGSAALTVRTQIQDEEWHHVAVVYDGSGNTKYLDLYVDGVQTDSTSTTGSPLSTYEGDPLRFGMTRHSSGEYSNCIMDEVRIWNKGRAQSEIQKYMNLELSGGEEGLVGYWKFNEAEGTTAYDSSPNQNHGTIVGATWTTEAAPVAAFPFLASSPSPARWAEDVPRDVVLSWEPGEFAAPTNGHKVYFGESFDDVNDATGGAAQTATSYTPAQRLDFGKTYYWRVDEVNAPPSSTIFKGDVWSFTAEPFAYPIAGERITATASSSGIDQGPENTVNGSGLDVNDLDLHSTDLTDMWLSDIAGTQPTWIQYEFDKVCKLHQMWVWNHNTLTEPVIGYGVKEATIEYSADGANWTTLGTTHEFARGSGAAGYAYNTTVDFGGVAVKYVRLTANSNWGGLLPQYGLSEVRFLYIPVWAREPNPASEATDVDVDVTLGFRAGREAAEHNVYLSSDEQAVIDGNAPVTTVTEASYSTSLDIASTYYWRVDEVNEAETPTTWQGDIWSFSTPEFFIVDDFEDYNDYPPDEIFSTWIDGYYDSANGALVANTEPPFAETTIVHGGDQSMPFFYDNTGGATYSEGERTFAVPQDWTKAGVQTLTLWFYGTAGNTGQLYVKVNGSKVVYDGDASNLALAGWQLWNIDLTSSGLNLQSVSSLAIGIDGFGASGTLYFDDIGLYALAPAPPNEWRIDDDADDVEEAVATGIISRTSGDLELPYENTGQADPQIIGVRFTGIPIPKGATITEAWVRFQVDEIKGGTEAVNLIIEGELSLDATGFTSDAFNVSSRPTTTAQVQWSVPNWTTVGDQGPDQTTPSIASIIQEIVNQDGWAGGTIVLMFRDNPANPSLGIRCAEAGPGSYAALLHISYQ